MRDPRLYLVIGFLAVVMLCVQVNPVMGQASSIANHVVINEVETDPLGDDSKSMLQWVELYNPTSGPVNIGGWTIGATTGLRNTYTISTGTTIQSGQFLTYTYGPSWFPHVGAVIQLKDKNGMVIDQTPSLYDQQNDFNTWQRITDGFSTNSTSDWTFKMATTGSSNGKPSSTETSSALSVTVAIDKTNYIFGDTVKISGQVSKQVNVPNLGYLPEQISILVTGPGFQKTITAYPDIYLKFATDLKTDTTLGFKEGNYKISVTYSDASTNTQFTLSEQAYVPPPQEAQTILTFNTDKPSYILGDPINVVGNVTKIIPLTPVTYKVFDPNKVIIYQGSIFPDSQGQLTNLHQYQQSKSTSGLLINTVNPIYGIYTITAIYGDASASATFTLAPVKVQADAISISTDKKAYAPGETAIISGHTNLIGIQNTGISNRLQIIQSFLATGNRGAVSTAKNIDATINFNPDGTFTYNFPIPGTSDSLGNYRAVFTISSGLAEADFVVTENPSAYQQISSSAFNLVTDKNSYALGDPIIISGQIANPITELGNAGATVEISILNSTGKSVISQGSFINNIFVPKSFAFSYSAYPDKNGIFNVKQTVQRGIYQPGNYTLKATYSHLSASTSFSVYDPLDTGNQAIVANTDKQVYGVGETVHLTGKLSSLVDPSSYTVKLTLPDGSIITNPLTITKGVFSWDWTIPNSSTTHGTLATIINSGRQNVVTINNYPNTFGIYRITIQSNHAKTDLFFGVSKNPQSETTLSPFFLETDKTDYTTTQTVQIFGQVIPQVNAAALEQNTMANIVVYTSTGQEASRATVQVNAGGQFQTSIELRPGIFQTGTYKIFGNYLGMSSQATFNVTDPFTTASNKLSLLLTTDSDKYLPGQTVLITGRTSFIVSVNTVDISVGLANDTVISEGQIVSKKGNVLPRVTVPFDQTSSFSYDYQIPQNAKLGNYVVMANVPFGIFSAPFQVVNQLPNMVIPQVNATQNTTQTTPQGNATQVIPPVSILSIKPSTIGPTQKTILSNTMTIDKVNRVTDSFIPIAIKEKTIGNSTFYPRMIDGLLRINPGDESNVNLKVIFEDGTCLIGQDSSCKITGSTQNYGSLYQTIQLGNQSFLVGYSGSGARLEKFTILPANASESLPDGQLTVQILKKDQPSRFYYQITYVSK